MLINRPKEALNEVYVRCLEASDHYSSAMEIIAHDPLWKYFRSLAEQRKNMAEQLESHVRKLGYPGEGTAIRKLSTTSSPG